MAAARLRSWATEQVSALAGFPDDGQIASYLLTLDTRAAVADYTREIFGESPAQAAFVDELWHRRGAGPEGQHLVQLKRERDDTATSARQPQFQSLVDPNKDRGLTVKYAKSSKSSAAAGQSKPIAVRHQCHCQAREHELYSNCTVCGRVVCASEGEGPCFFCGSHVTKHQSTPSQQFVEYMRAINEALAESVDATDTSSSSDTNSGLEAAEATKRRLLDYAARNIARSRVFNVDSDYYEFEGNAWMNAEEKKTAMATAKKREEKIFARGAHTVDIDLVTGAVTARQRDSLLEESESKGAVFVTRDDETKAQSHSDYARSRSGVNDAGVNAMVDEMKIVSRAQYFRNDTLHGRARLIYQQLQSMIDSESDEKCSDQTSVSLKANFQSPFTSRVQYDDNDRVVSAKSVLGVDGLVAASDGNEPSCRALQSLSLSAEPQPAPVFDDASDQGVTLSMHQPWASLLVLGIKRLEGRGWYTPYRGRLWIASASHETSEDDIASIEAEARAVYGENAKVPFPTHYPRSALLGCVDLMDVLDQPALQRHRQQMGMKENSQASYVMICANPRVLALPQTIAGHHKLWNLPSKLLSVVQRGLQPVNERWRTGKPEAKSMPAGSQLKQKKLTTKLGPRKPNEE